MNVAPMSVRRVVSVPVRASWSATTTEPRTAKDCFTVRPLLSVVSMEYSPGGRPTTVAVPVLSTWTDSTSVPSLCRMTAMA